MQGKPQRLPTCELLFTLLQLIQTFSRSASSNPPDVRHTNSSLGVSVVSILSVSLSMHTQTTQHTHTGRVKRGAFGRNLEKAVNSHLCDMVHRELLLSNTQPSTQKQPSCHSYPLPLANTHLVNVCFCFFFLGND